MKIFDYEESFGTVVYSDGFLETIRDLSIDEQMNYFRISGSTSFSKTNWSERTLNYTKPLDRCADFRGVIVKDGCIAGAMICSWTGKDVPVLPEKGI